MPRGASSVQVGHRLGQRRPPSCIRRQEPQASRDWTAYAIDLGHNLHRRRSELGLSQEQVAYRARLSRFTYQKYESGLSRPDLAANPSVRSLLAIAQVLDVPLSTLLPLDPPVLTARCVIHCWRSRRTRAADHPWFLWASRLTSSEKFAIVRPIVILEGIELVQCTQLRKSDPISFRRFLHPPTERRGSG